MIRLVNTIIGRVIDLRASDIHLEPFDDGLHVRYRVDGVIHPGELVPPRLSAAVNSRGRVAGTSGHCTPPAARRAHQDPCQGA